MANDLKLNYSPFTCRGSTRGFLEQAEKHLAVQHRPSLKPPGLSTGLKILHRCASLTHSKHSEFLWCTPLLHSLLLQTTEEKEEARCTGTNMFLETDLLPMARCDLDGGKNTSPASPGTWNCSGMWEIIWPCFPFAFLTFQNKKGLEERRSQVEILAGQSFILC